MARGPRTTRVELFCSISSSSSKVCVILNPVLQKQGIKGRCNNVDVFGHTPALCVVPSVHVPYQMAQQPQLRYSEILRIVLLYQ